MKQGKNSQFLFTALLAASFLPFLLSSCSKPETVVVEPVEIDDVLVNPGMGFTTFYSFNNDEINANHPECSIAYYRWYWEVLEPEEGRVNFAMIDSVLALCREKGQKLAFRVMCQNGHEMADKSVTEKWEVPDWFRNSGVAGCTYENGRGWQPDYDSSFFLEKHGNLLRALGARYDGHPDLDHVDIGSVGRWGATGGRLRRLRFACGPSRAPTARVDCRLRGIGTTAGASGTHREPAARCPLRKTWRALLISTWIISAKRPW